MTVKSKLLQFENFIFGGTIALITSWITWTYARVSKGFMPFLKSKVIFSSDKTFKKTPLKHFLWNQCQYCATVLANNVGI